MPCTEGRFSDNPQRFIDVSGSISSWPTDGAARLLDVSRTTVEAWRREGVLTPATRHRRHEVTVDRLMQVQALVSGLRRLGRIRELGDYIWWSAQDKADHANGQLAEALRQLRAGELADEYIPSQADLEQARRELGRASAQEDT